MCAWLFSLGFCTSFVSSLDRVAMEGDMCTLHCDINPVRDITSRDCTDSLYYFWTSPTNKGCVDNEDDCPAVIGGYCTYEELLTYDCWQPCMTIHANMSLEINPVMMEYEGNYDCKKPGSIPTNRHTLVVAGKMEYILIVATLK